MSVHLLAASNTSGRYSLDSMTGLDLSSAADLAAWLSYRIIPL